MAPELLQEAKPWHRQGWDTPGCLSRSQVLPWSCVGSPEGVNTLLGWGLGVLGSQDHPSPWLAQGTQTSPTCLHGGAALQRPPGCAPMAQLLFLVRRKVKL